MPDGVSRVHVTQSEALGLGHAILCAESVVGDEPFAVLLADVFAFRAMARAEALVPGGVLFVFVGALGADRLRVETAVLVVAAGVVATAALRQLHAGGSQRIRPRTSAAPAVP